MIFIPNDVDMNKKDLLENKLYYFKKVDNFKQAKCYLREMECDEGYADKDILEAVIDSQNKVLAGKALYEQDGVAYYKEHNNYELLFSLYYTYSKSESFNVLDFGGALGCTFFRYQNILPKSTKWFIVEQKHYVEYGKNNIRDIIFYNSIDDCQKEHDINVLLMSSVLQYIEDTYETIKKICDLKIPFIIIDETPFVGDEEYSGTYIQHIPKLHYGCEKYYPVNIFFKSRILSLFLEHGYKKTFEWLYDGTGKGIPIIDGNSFRETVNRGFLLELFN